MPGEPSPRAIFRHSVSLGERQHRITDRLYDAVKSHQLQPIALLRTAAGSWEELGIPRRDSLGGEGR